MADFANKVIAISGAASGFGKLLAARLSDAGAKLSLSDINHAALCEASAALGDDILLHTCDVADEAQMREWIDRTLSSFGRIDIAINNAGISAPMKSLVDTTEADMDRNFGINAKGVFFGLKYQIPPMVAQGGGSILNVASMAGLYGAPKLTAYVAAKHAVIGITKTAALEYARHNVRINAICPYFSPTPLVADVVDKSLTDRLAHAAPMKRLGRPEEMVAAMLSIVDPANSYMTGQAIAVDGGVSAI